MNINELPRVVLVSRCIVKNENDELLIIQRAHGDTYNSGLWELPGGKLDSGQDLRHTLEREGVEETGLLVCQDSDLSFVDSYVIGRGPYKGMPYIAIFSLARVIGGKFKLSSEHEQAAWEPYDTALNYELTPESRKAIIILGRSILDAS